MAKEKDEDFVLISEPLNPMLNMAMECHRLLQSYMTAGFTRVEAFDLLLNQLPEWNFPNSTVIEEEIIDDDDDDLWEDIPDEMTEDDHFDD